MTEELEKQKPREEAKRLGWEVVYISHEEIEDYNACYRVEYQGDKIYPPAADDLGIPLNEIWISEKLKEFEKYVLYHEIREIKYRARGCDVSTAHEKADEDEKVFEGDPSWERLRREINMASPEILRELADIESDTFEQIMGNRPYYRMEELQEIPEIDGDSYHKLKENFWSFY